MISNNFISTVPNNTNKDNLSKQIINEIRSAMIDEINFMCENLYYANANPNQFNFYQLLRWFGELKELQVKKKFHLHCFKKNNVNETDYSQNSVKVFNFDITRDWLFKNYKCFISYKRNFLPKY